MFAVTGILVAAQAASTPVALAASHHRHARHAHVASASGLDSFVSARAGVTARSPVGVTASVPCVNADLIPTSGNIPQIDAATLCLINQQRALHGESALRDSARLDSAATQHSQDMVTADYFDHISPTGNTPLDRIRASGYVVSGDVYELGENIDLGTYQLATPASIVTDWMNSPDHRANILDSDFVDSGIGVVAQAPAQYAGAQPGATYTQDFGAQEAPDGAIS
jgi:uncharacterized protein YkwD